MLAFVFAVLLAIDPARSSAHFSVQHVFVERVDGTVPILRGSVDLPAGSLVPAHVTAELDATSIHTDDPDRDAALMSPDWFDSKAYPLWRFTSTKIVPDSSGFSMTGMLTIHGVSQPETLAVATAGTTEHPHYRATCTVDRHAFGLKPNRLDAAIGNAVDITLDISLK